MKYEAIPLVDSAKAFVPFRGRPRVSGPTIPPQFVNVSLGHCNFLMCSDSHPWLQSFGIQNRILIARTVENRTRHVAHLTLSRDFSAASYKLIEDKLNFSAALLTRKAGS